MTEQHTPSVTQADRDAAKAFDPLLWEEHPHGEDFQALILAFCIVREQAQSESAELIRELVETLDAQTTQLMIACSVIRAAKIVWGGQENAEAVQQQACATLAKAREVQS